MAGLTHTLQDRNDIPYVLRQIEEARSKKVLVGFPGDTGDNQEVAGYAHQNEFGTIRVPERAFLRPAFDSEELLAYIADTVNALMFRGANVLKLLHGIGVEGVEAVRTRIRSNTPPPNAPLTVKLKKSESTLIHTGRMIQSVKHAVEDR